MRQSARFALSGPVRTQTSAPAPNRTSACTTAPASKVASCTSPAVVPSVRTRVEETPSVERLADTSCDWSPSIGPGRPMLAAGTVPAELPSLVHNVWYGWVGIGPEK